MARYCPTRPPLVIVPLLLLVLGRYRLVEVADGALIPQSPAEQTRLAVRSLKQAMASAGADGRPKRFYVDYLVPLPPATKAEDIDPWPGGLAQMYPYAEDIVREILGGVVGAADGSSKSSSCSSQVLSAPDCCGFFVQESPVSPQEDVGAILFPGVDQLDKIREIDAMVGEDRTLLLFNRQFQRPADFGFVGDRKAQAQQHVFDRFAWGFAFQELACRGEDVKLTFDFPTWTSCAVLDEDAALGTREIDLLPPTTVRPAYNDLEKEINRKLPEPLWMRKMGEVDRKGFKFQRGSGEASGDGKE